MRTGLLEFRQTVYPDLFRRIISRKRLFLFPMRRVFLLEGKGVDYRLIPGRVVSAGPSYAVLELGRKNDIGEITLERKSAKVRDITYRDRLVSGFD